MTLSSLLGWFVTLAILCDVNHGQTSTKDRCSFDPEPDELTCSLRTLNERNGTLISATRARSIRVQCSDVFFYESFLRTNHFGYLPDLGRLQLEFCKIRKIPSLAFSGLPDLKTLTLKSRNSEWSAMVMELEVDSLTGLQDLQVLNLTQNNLWNLPPEVFCDLHKLRVLNLSHNFLRDVQDLGLSSKSLRVCNLPLQNLDLSHNILSEIPAQSLGQLRHLQMLNLADNNINILDDDALSNLLALTSINLSNNDLVALPPYVFKATSSLQEVYLQNNSLNALAPGVFSNLNQLLVLNISRNELTNDWLNSRTFENMNRLVALDLSHNRLTQVDKNLFSDLASLQILNLNFNRILQIEPNTFSANGQLNILYLSYNRIENLPAKAIQSLGHLASVSLDHNLIKSLHRNLFKNCSKLQDLALHNNNLQEVPKALKHLPMLRTLDLGNNNLVHLRNNSFDGLAQLYGLRLSYNSIRHIHQSVFDAVPALHVLNLAHNKLEKLEQDTLKALGKLKMLRMDNNLLEDINGLLTTQSELRWLNISSNRLHWFDYAFIPRSVRWLDLHDNNLEDLGNYYELNDGFGLVTIDASGNKIKKLSSSSILPSMEYIFLDENEIDEIAFGTFVEKPNLKRVELRGNKLQSLTMSAISTAATEKTEEALSQDSDARESPEFFLGNNPFVCDCNMEWLQKINSLSSKGEYPRIVDLEDIKCNVLDQQESVVSLVDMSPARFVCQYQAHCFALCKCCDFVACDCRMQCPKGCSCFHDSAWSSNVIQCSKREHTTIPALIPMDATAIHLDGNQFNGMLESQAFIGRKRVTSLYLNNSNIDSISNQTFNGLSELESLHLQNNEMLKLKGFEFANLTSLRELHLENNLLSEINEVTFSPLKTSLEVLHLEGNRLTKFPLADVENQLPRLKKMYLAGNAWACDCDFVKKFQELQRSGKIADSHLIHCFSSTKNALVNLSANISCTDALAVVRAQDETTLQNWVPILIGIVAVVIMLVCVTVLIFVFGTPLKIWFHSKYGLRFLEPSNKPGNLEEANKLYDALVSYSSRDMEFVHQILAPRLELEDCRYKLFLQHRDSPNPGTPLSESFPGLSLICANLVLVVTKYFVEQEWKELKYFIQDVNGTSKRRKRKNVPILILLEDISTLQLAGFPDFNLLLQNSIVIRWNEAGFWNKLRYHLPENKSRSLPPLKGEKPLVDAEWPYDTVIHSNNSSTSTRSTIMGGSPRTLANDQQLTMNNADMGSDSVYSWQDHTYQSIPANGHNNIYNTLSDQDVPRGETATLGCVDVMLPNGQMVPATLVRNHATGKIVPIIQVNSVIKQQQSNNRREMPPPPPPPPLQLSEEYQPLRQVTFPRTVVYNTRQNNNSNTTGHLV